MPGPARLRSTGDRAGRGPLGKEGRAGSVSLQMLQHFGLSLSCPLSLDHVGHLRRQFADLPSWVLLQATEHVEGRLPLGSWDVVSWCEYDVEHAHSEIYISTPSSLLHFVVNACAGVVTRLDAVASA
jgi:hypothetical protein